MSQKQIKPLQDHEASWLVIKLQNELVNLPSSFSSHFSVHSMIKIILQRRVSYFNILKFNIYISGKLEHLLKCKYCKGIYHWVYRSYVSFMIISWWKFFPTLFLILLIILCRFMKDSWRVKRLFWIAPIHQIHVREEVLT